jgi:H+-translocating NAD(P) transhydrogenase subunit beta
MGPRSKRVYEPGSRSRRHVFEFDRDQSGFCSTDVAFVVGANDVTNAAATTEFSSPIYGVPILDVEGAKTEKM